MLSSSLLRNTITKRLPTGCAWRIQVSAPRAVPLRPVNHPGEHHLVLAHKVQDEEEVKVRKMPESTESHRNTHEGEDMLIIRRKRPRLSNTTIGSLGGLIGFAAGEFLFLQVLSYLGFVTIHWSKVEESAERHAIDQETFAHKMKSIITHNIPFKAGVLAGFVIGFRYG